MSATRPSTISDVMVAAADLEDAEFERDRLAMAFGEAIRQALATGHTHVQIARAANLPEAEVRRLADVPPTGAEPVPDGLSFPTPRTSDAAV
ncbi:hypothetical protein FDK12_05160 [Arthrobacter sp. NamB2]|uniref:hypothetical protein n=1 Tax=Arthrobacter sp. NamB2 TaxID=2576035 RepID=UPI0010C9C4FB|nr:hypothetical protein [Arthrobacter sp. NamB2]TKV29044.1 hypothetical protein FDK12_05160 [Arthrobacter sp. NamB2]